MRRPLPVKPGMRQPVPTPVQGGGMSRPAMPGKPDMGGMMQRPVTPGPGTTPPGGMMAQETITPASGQLANMAGRLGSQTPPMPANLPSSSGQSIAPRGFKKGGMVSGKKAKSGSSVPVRGGGCEVRGVKACKMS